MPTKKITLNDEMKNEVTKQVIQTIMGDDVKKIIADQVTNETENIAKSVITTKGTYQLIKFVLDKSMDLSLEYNITGLNADSLSEINQILYNLFAKNTKPFAYWKQNEVDIDYDLLQPELRSNLKINLLNLIQDPEVAQHQDQQAAQFYIPVNIKTQDLNDIRANIEKILQNEKLEIIPPQTSGISTYSTTISQSLRSGSPPFIHKQTYDLKPIGTLVSGRVPITSGAATTPSDNDATTPSDVDPSVEIDAMSPYLDVDIKKYVLYYWTKKNTLLTGNCRVEIMLYKDEVNPVASILLLESNQIPNDFSTGGYLYIHLPMDEYPQILDLLKNGLHLCHPPGANISVFNSL